MNIELTLYNTFNKTIESMRMIGDSNPKLLKKILYYIVLNDIKEWAEYKKDTCIVNNLTKYLNFMLQLDCEFDYINKDNSLFVGLSIPGNYLESQRIFDNPNAVILDEIIYSDSTSTNINNCKSEVVLYPGFIRDIEITRNKNGSPNIIRFNELTVCEKMSIFIDRMTGKAYYYDEHNNLQPVQAEIAEDSTVQWDQIDINSRPIIYLGLDLLTENGVNLSLIENNLPSVEFPIVSSEDINNLE